MSLEIVQVVGTGLYGCVCVVRDPEADQLWAAKVLRAEHVPNERVVSRLRDEARLLARIDHPGIVGIHGLRWVDDRPVLLMEWVCGVSLADLLARTYGGLEVPDALELVRLASVALDAAHHAAPDGVPLGLVHRDINPGNLLLSIGGGLKVVDFGIAHAVFEDKESRTQSMMLGALNFVSPERRDGLEDVLQGDVWAMGHVLYQLLTGEELSLSMNTDRHREGLTSALAQLPARGLGAEARRHLAALLGDMCAYEVVARPTHAQVAARIDALLLLCARAPDLPFLVEDRVWPLVEARAALPPQQHPGYAQIAFLEAGATDTGGRAADERVRAFLADPDWLSRQHELRRMLARDPSWSSAPLLEVLERALPRWLPRRSARVPHPAEVAGVLDLLRARPDRAVVDAARKLTAYADAEVAHMARKLVARSEHA